MSSKKIPQEDRQVFKILGIIFSIMGIGFIFSEATRATGIPFLAMGVTFAIVGYVPLRDTSSKK